MYERREIDRVPTQELGAPLLAVATRPPAIAMQFEKRVTLLFDLAMIYTGHSALTPRA